VEVGLNPEGNFNAAVIPAKSTTPSYCNRTASVENPSPVSTSNLGFAFRSGQLFDRSASVFLYSLFRQRLDLFLFSPMWKRHWNVIRRAPITDENHPGGQKGIDDEMNGSVGHLPPAIPIVVGVVAVVVGVPA
jgi:hypothetical protein